MKKLILALILVLSIGFAQAQILLPIRTTPVTAETSIGFVVIN